MKRVSVLLSLSLLLLFNSVAGAATETRSALGNMHIMAFAQDPLGYLWIGTAKGLCRYNGYEYVTYFHSETEPSSIPSDMITALFIDSYGELWVGTDKEYCRYDKHTDSFITRTYNSARNSFPFYYGFLENDGKLLVYGSNGIGIIDRENMEYESVEATKGMMVTVMVPTDDGNYLIGTGFGQGLYLADPELVEFSIIEHDSRLEYKCSYNARYGEIWLGTNRGIRKVTAKRGKYLCEDIPQSAIFPVTFIHDIGNSHPAGTQQESRILIGTGNSGLYMSVRSERLELYKPDIFPQLTSLHPTCAFTDRDGNTWIGTFDKGYAVEHSMPYSFNDDPALNALLQGKFVTRIAEDARGGLWIGTRNYGLYYYDKETGRSVVYNKKNFGPFSEAGNDFIQSLFIDSRGDAWVGYDKNLLRLARGDASSCKVYPMNSDVVCIAEDPYGKIWAGTSTAGITVFDPGGKNQPVSLYGNRWANITNIYGLESGEMIFSFYDTAVYIADPETLEIKLLDIPEHYHRYTYRTISILEDDRSFIWLGTYGNGVVRYDRRTGEAVQYGKNEIAGNDVLSVLQDSNGNIWMSTSTGLSVYDYRDDHFRSFYDYDGSGGDQYHEKAGMVSHEGILYFGGNHGLTYFRPEDLSSGNRLVQVIPEDLLILNRSAGSGEGAVLDKHISMTGEIVLNHRQNVFSIDYVGIDFASSQKLRYAYRLRNFDREWNYVGHHRRASYSNLSPGRYIFEVMAQNSDGAWSSEPTTLNIRVKAAPWLTPLAIVIYMILALGSLYLIFSIYVRISLDKERLELVQRERNHEQEVNDMKIRFFSNISHELRTPLSMVYGPVKKLRSVLADGPQADYLLGLAEYNSEKLLRLADQLMDFSKLENDTLGLSIEHVRISDILKNTADIFGYYAGEKGIELKIELPEDNPELYVDRDKIDKITANLLSNAIKYTPEGGEVILKASVRDSAGGPSLEITVTDNGIGMKQEDIAKLFTRYKRFVDQYSNKTTGKGIGLNYSRRLAEMHLGTLEARLRAGGGMVFTLIVPAGKDNYPENAIVAPSNGEPYPDQVPVLKSVSGTGQLPTAANVKGDERKSVLIAEDNEELLSYLYNLLSDKYCVITASDGAKALEICGETTVDLILSDVLMPNMNGYELCSAIKNDRDLCHIPVILLTAKNLDTDKIEGYTAGADVYVNKPFNPDVLTAIIGNVFSNIHLRQQALSRQGGPGEETAQADELTSVMNPLDARFLQKLYDRLDQDLSNSSLNINTLSIDMGFSRTSFYRKIKSLTGQTPNDFMRSYRLNKATVLLRTNQYTVNEIVDMTGFGTHSHFTLCFKKQFGITPKQYMKDRK